MISVFEEDIYLFQKLIDMGNKPALNSVVFFKKLLAGKLLRGFFKHDFECAK